MCRSRSKFYLLIEKILSLAIIIAFSPMLLIIACLNFVFFDGSVLFRQNRVGKGESIFKIYKFTSMLNSLDNKGRLLPDHLRLTRYGRFLRVTSLDELPQLINILKGEMSFVGPRALVTDYLQLYSEKEKFRHLIRPGLTGLAQINGRNKISWKNKFRYDLFYVKNRSVMLDIKIALKTILTIVDFGKVNKSADVVMDRYDGSN